MRLSEEWENVPSDTKYLSSIKNGVEKEGITKMSMLFCRHGGLITPVSSGQNAVAGDGKNDEYPLLLDLIKSMEIGDIHNIKNSNYVLDDISGNIIGIEIQNANDGYVTLGYGFIIQTEADAKKYGFDTWTKQDVDEITRKIEAQKKQYKSDAENPAILSKDEAEKLLREELDQWYGKAEELCKKYNPAYTANQLNAVACNIYNSGTAHIDDPDSLQYYLVRNDKEGAMDVLHKADDNNWYGDNGGLLRRRLMEYNIYVNQDYDYYDSNRLEELKKITGFTK